jgi:hypothetical protein
LSCIYEVYLWLRRIDEEFISSDPEYAAASYTKGR